MDLIVALLLLFVAARLAGEAFERLRQSPMIGEVLAGVLLGPAVLGLIHPDVTAEPGASLAIVSQLGVLVLVLLAGIELGREGLRQAFKERSMVVAYLEFILPFTMGYVLATLLGLSFGQALFLGTALAVTALPVSVRILLDLNLLHSRLGRAIVSVALVNDLVAFAMLGLVLEINRLGATPPSADVFLLIVAKNLAFFGIVLSGSLALTYAMRTRTNGESYMEGILRRQKGQESTFAFCVILALALGAAAETVGIHFAIGVFYAGILLSPRLLGREPFHHMRRSMSAVTFGLFAPIFFAFVGLNFTFTSASWALILVITGTAFAGKLAGGILGGYVAGFRGSPLVALGVGLNARGMMELLLAQVGLATGIISAEIYTSLIVMTLVTTLVTPPLLKRLLRRFKLEDVLPARAASSAPAAARPRPPEGVN
ncbi:MAG TPA: cation:proton antiporter [Thermoplasmata archaeon]|nr:cation:proton antiporter [Thermoplasmata archaeon]